jgi:hypothetical protein
MNKHTAADVIAEEHSETWFAAPSETLLLSCFSCMFFHLSELPYART